MLRIVFADTDKQMFRDKTFVQKGHIITEKS